MRVLFFSLTILFGSADAFSAETEAEGPVAVTEDAVATPKVAGNLDIKNSADGSYPGGATPKIGKWSVDAAAKKLRVNAMPLVEGWMEFGPEIREKGATMTAIVRAPGEGRLQSRFGAGLYGKNGFQLRAIQVSDSLQLVRRGEVLHEVSADLEPGETYHLELAVLEDEEHWKISGRIWLYETPRPEEAMVDMRFPAAELLFPLAGRPVITATPFSGEPVSFLGSTAYYGLFVTPDPEPEVKDDLKKAPEDEDEGE